MEGSQVLFQKLVVSHYLVAQESFEYRMLVEVELLVELQVVGDFQLETEGL